jgi:hypothetical protein
LEYPFAIDCPRSCCRRRQPNLICESEGIPCDRSDSHQTETALAVVPDIDHAAQRPCVDQDRNHRLRQADRCEE